MRTVDLKINDLKNKLSYWQKNGKSELVGNVDINLNSFAKEFGIVSTDSGYYYLSDSLVGYYDLNLGTEFRLKKVKNDKHWKCFIDLADISTKNNFRIINSTFNKEVLLNGDNWIYAELDTPNKEHGITFENEVFEWPPLSNGVTPNTGITDTDRANLVKLYKELVDQRKNILPHLQKIATENNVGIPIEVCNLSALYKDSIGYFWSDLDCSEWTIPINDFDNVSNRFLMGSFNIAIKCGMMTEEQAQEIYKYNGGI